MELALINMPCDQQEYIKFDKKWDFIDEEYLGINIIQTISENLGIDVFRYQENTSFESFKKELFFKKIKLIVISIMQTSAKNALSFIKEVKEKNPEIKIIIGGWFVKNAWKDIFEEGWPVDAACITDAEGVFDIWLSRYFKNEKTEVSGIVTKDNYFTYISNFEENFTWGKWPKVIYMPKRLADKGVYGIETSRGCSHSSCSFCSLSCITNYKKYWTPRCLSEAADEIEYLNKVYGAKKFTIIDDDFLGPPKQSKKRALEFFQEIKKRNLNIEFSASVSVLTAIQEECLDILKEAGLKQLCIGFESVDDEQLKRYRKMQKKEDNYLAAQLLRKKNINLVPGLITFDAFATPKTVERNISFLFDQLEHFELSKLTKKVHVVTGTPIAESLKEQGILEGNYLNYKYKFQNKDTGRIYEEFQEYTKAVADIQIKLRNSSQKKSLQKLHKKYVKKILKLQPWRELLKIELINF
ncbi:MAG: B12-binding domain-containing radical SAM protein [Fusobacteriaceae bacterium]